jgi:arginase
VIGPPVILGAPSAIGLRPYDDGGARNVDKAPDVLRRQRLAQRLGARDLGDVLPPARYEDLVKPEGRGRNERDVAAYSADLAERIAKAAREEEFVLLLGGDCSILLGALLGLRRSGKLRLGLVYIDAHADFATLEESQSGSACSMNLALAVGRSTTPLSRLADRAAPLVEARNVVHVGARDAGEPYGHAALGEWKILSLDDTVLQRDGPGVVAERALAHVSELDGGFWIHADVDVLDPRIMPAVDTPQSGGLSFDALAELLQPIVAHPTALGMQLTIYDPTLDNSAAAPALAELLQAVVGQA